MYVQPRATREMDNRKTHPLQAVRPSNQVAREQIAAFRQKLHTGGLDGAEEALQPRGPVSQLKLG